MPKLNVGLHCSLAELFVTESIVSFSVQNSWFVENLMSHTSALGTTGHQS